MKIVEIFQANGINIICVDRQLTWSERSKKTVKIKDLVLTVNATTNDRWISSGDEIENAQSLAGEEIELV